MIAGIATLFEAPILFGVVALVALVLGGCLGAIVFSWWNARDTIEDELDEELPEDEDVIDLFGESEGEESRTDENVGNTENQENIHPVDFDLPEISMSPLDWIRAGRHLQKQRKAAKRGWVKWYRVGANFSRPQWVKPVREGSGRPKVATDDGPYYFDKDAMVVDERTGAYVAVHPEGEADPINLADRAYPGIETDLVERILNLEAENDPSESLFGLDGMSTQQLMWLGIGALFIVFAAYRYMG